MRPRIVALLLFTVSLGYACASAPNRPMHEPAASGHGFALLYEILGQERQVSKLLRVKGERNELETVIDAIDTTCDTAYERLDLADTGLPAADVCTRLGIAATGREFELQFLWTQNEALAYASHLADTLARREADLTAHRELTVREFATGLA